MARATQADPHIDRRLKKLKVPVFEGIDPDKWIYRAEWYFLAQGFTEAEVL